MALTITAVPDIKFVLGQSGRLQEYQFQPGVADYVTGGYPVAAQSVELGQIVGFDMLGVNAAGALYAVTPVFPAGSFGANPAPATTINLVVTLAGVQVAAGTDLSAITFFANILGW